MSLMVFDPLWVVEVSRHKKRTQRFFFDNLPAVEIECRHWEAMGWMVRYWNAWGEPAPEEQGVAGP